MYIVFLRQYIHVYVWFYFQGCGVVNSWSICLSLDLLKILHYSQLKILTSFVYIIIQILDVDRMLAKSATPAEIIAMETPQQAMENHPVIRTLYDHIDVSASFTRC